MGLPASLLYEDGNSKNSLSVLLKAMFLPYVLSVYLLETYTGMVFMVFVLSPLNCFMCMCVHAHVHRWECITACMFRADDNVSCQPSSSTLLEPEFLCLLLSMLPQLTCKFLGNSPASFYLVLGAQEDYWHLVLWSAFCEFEDLNLGACRASVLYFEPSPHSLTFR